MTLSAPDTQVPANRELSLYKPLLALSVVALLIALTGFYIFQQIEGLIEKDKLARPGGDRRHESRARLPRGVTTIKRLGETFSRDSVLAAEFGQWLQEGALPNERMQRLRKMAGELQQVNGYKTLFLLDRRGAVRISAGTRPDFGAEETRQALQAMNSREVVFFDFHRNSYGDKGISIDLIAPLHRCRQK